MEPRHISLLNDNGQPLPPHIEQALVSLIPKFHRHFTSFRDDAVVISVFEEAGRKIAQREQRSGAINRLHAYAWVAVRSVAISRLRRGVGRLDQKIVASEEGDAALDSTGATWGSADQVERAILLRELMEGLRPEERLVCVWKMAGFSSQEIGHRLGRTPVAIDTLLSRIRQKVRRVTGDGGDAPRDTSDRKLHDAEPSPALAPTATLKIE